eukprot:gene50344-68449_t
MPAGYKISAHPAGAAVFPKTKFSHSEIDSRPPLSAPLLASHRFPMRLRFFALLFSCFAALATAAEPPAAIVLVAGDMHSAYERTAQFVALVDRVRAENPGVPVAVLIAGDTFELGNAVAQRSAGAIEFAMCAALASRVPTVVTLGNHEPEFHGVAETVAKLTAAGVTVLS